MTDHATKTFYDRISHAYDFIADSGERDARERGLAQLNVQPGESVLEIGFGTGHSLLSLATAVGADGHVTGIDISTGMREIAAKRIAAADLADRVELRVGSVPPIPADLGPFDAITMSFTLELFGLETIPKVLAECRRLLRRDGRLGVVSMATVAPGDHTSMLERTYVWMHTHFPHIVDCQPIPLESLLETAGFKLAQRERVELFTMPVAIAVAHQS